MALVAKRIMTETWREALRRVGARAGREADCLAAYDAARREGTPEHEAAYRTLKERGLLEHVDLPGDPSGALPVPT
ncbi:hypothetical protein [Salinarimonas soli]|uniref:Uncharacterized protein n=1 Tax=Salinarimonas soli TaxID=1638099 RepID=A0A5B2VGH9_9HYPH|nr:hypothetical protein [Salinarimonas soli]KAA2237738.1 hypothetical protein F0L46_08665 [Salinarimonas soli]